MTVAYIWLRQFHFLRDGGIVVELSIRYLHERFRTCAFVAVIPIHLNSEFL